MDAKAEILARISAARVNSCTASRPVEPAASLSPSEVVEQFAEYAAEYKARVTRVAAADLPAAIAEALAVHGSERVVLPADLPTDWLPEGPTYLFDHGLSHAEIDAAHAVITGSAVAVAETGTVVLDAGPGQGRRVITLIPDHHVCIVREDQVVASVPEAVALLHQSILKGQPLTWISGPSATSDIELSRVEGVHGPRNLDIVIVRYGEPPR